jgi:hypothetical protein
VLLIPVLLVLAGAVSQTMLLAQSRLYVEQAAYAAARSALVHKCPPPEVYAMYGSARAVAAGAACRDEPGKWEDAARWALVAAAPSSGFARSRGACPEIAAAGELVGGTDLSAGLRDAAANRICYAYEPENVVVEVDWVRAEASPLLATQTRGIRATVRFRYPLTTPFRRFLYDEKRGDGTYWRWGEATVVLL